VQQISHPHWFDPLVSALSASSVLCRLRESLGGVLLFHRIYSLSSPRIPRRSVVEAKEERSRNKGSHADIELLRETQFSFTISPDSTTRLGAFTCVAVVLSTLLWGLCENASALSLDASSTSPFEPVG